MSANARTLLMALGLLLVIGFFLTTEHRAHLFGVLPFLLILACPLLHMFGHGGHGRHGSHGRHGGVGESQQSTPAAAIGTPSDDPHREHRATREDMR